MKFVHSSEEHHFSGHQLYSLSRWKKASRARSGPIFFRSLISLVILLSFSIQNSLAQEGIETPLEPSAPWNIQYVDAYSYIDRMTNRSLATRPYDGAPCIAYGGDHLYYSCAAKVVDPNVHDGYRYIWTTTVVDGSTRVGEYAALAFSNNNHPFITYYDVTNKKLKLAYDDGSWHVLFVPDHPTVPTMLEEDIQELELTTEQPGVPAEQTEAPTGQPALSTEQTQTPTDQPAVSTEQTVEPTDQPAVSTIQPELSTERPAPETFEEQLRRLLQPWLTPLIDSEPDVQSPDFDYDETPGVGKHTSIDVDNLNQVHITFLDDIDSSFWYVRWNGSDWDFKLVDYYPDRKRVGLWSSIAVDGERGVHISYMSEKYDSLKYAHRKPNGNWKQCTVDGKAPGGYYNWNSTGSFSSIALDYDDGEYIPHISYYDFGSGDLRHAWLTFDECYEGVHRDNYNRGWETQTVDGGDVNGWWTSIAINSSGGIYISYYDASDSELKYAYKSRSGSWASKLIDTDSGNSGHLTSIAFASDGLPGISYFNAEDGTLEYTKCKNNCTHANNNTNGSKWDGPSTVYLAYFRDVGLSTSLAVRSDNVPYISYLDTSSGYLKYAQALGSVWWKGPLLTSPHAGLFSSIQLYGGTDPRIAFYDHDNGDLMWASLGGTGWTFSDIDTSYDVGQYISMALGSTGIPQMSYYDASNKDLIYAYWDTLAVDWITQTLDTVGDVGMYTSLTLDSSNKPYISYYDATKNALKYAFKSPIDAWVIRIVDDPVDINVGLYPSITVKGSYLPYITYYDETNGDLKYAYSTDPAGEVWNISYVDNSVNDVGKWSSMKWYSADDSLHLCYYDGTDMDLMYAKGTGAGAITWAIEKVDTNGDVGLFCSMGLTSTGKPEISYYDNSGGDLKIALDASIPPFAPVKQLFFPLVHRVD